MRIQKLLAQLGYGSRREIEEMIHDGRIEVNRRAAEIGQILTGKEHITLDGATLKLLVPRPRMLMYYKPSGEICSHQDTVGKGTCFDRLPSLMTGRWQSVGRLDTATTGLLLFATSGEWVQYLTHPKQALERIYWVKLDGELTYQHLTALRNGVELSDGVASIARYERLMTVGNATTCEVTVTEGRNRLVRRLFEHLGFRVKKLKRLQYGPFSLPAKLKPGQFAEIDDATIQWLDKKIYRHNQPKAKPSRKKESV